MPKEETQEEVKLPETLQPTSVEDWGKKEVAPAEDEGFIIELPSGNVVKVRRTLDLIVLLKAGRIPNPLAGVVQRMIDTKSTDFPTEEMDGQMVEQLYDLLARNAVKMMISPPVDMPEARMPGEKADAYQKRLESWKPAQGKLSVFEIDMNDLLFMMGVGQGQAADLASFREEQAGGMAPAQDGDGVRSDTGNRAARRAKSKR